MPKAKLKSAQKSVGRPLGAQRHIKQNLDRTFRHQLSPDYLILVALLFISGGVAIAQGGFWIAVLLYTINILALLWSRDSKKR